MYSSNISRLHHFDIMKGIAIILMVMGHVMQFSFGFNPSEPVKSIYFNMPLFFYISGYLAYKRFQSAGEVCQRIGHRGMLLLVPYIAFLCLYHVFSTSELPSISTLLGGGGRYWFLYTLFILSVFFMVFEYVIRKVEREWLYIALWMLPFCLLVIVKSYIARSNEWGGYFDVIMGLVNYYRYYLIGYFCRKYIRFNHFLFENELTFALGFVAYFLNWYFYDLHNMFLIFFGTLGAIIMMQTFVRCYINADDKCGRLLVSVGKCSLGIYVIHYFFIPDISNMASQFLDCGNPYIWQLACATIVAIPVVAASVFVFKTIEMNRHLSFIFLGKKISKQS